MIKEKQSSIINNGFIQICEFFGVFTIGSSTRFYQSLAFIVLGILLFECLIYSLSSDLNVNGRNFHSEKFNSRAILQFNQKKNWTKNLLESFVISSNFRTVNFNELNYKRKVKILTGCFDTEFKQKTRTHGNYIILRNFIRAEHGEIGCGDSVTYVSHGDVSFLDNLIPVLERWNGPLSIALMSAGTDFDLTLKSIKYLQHCLPQSKLVRKFATFHFFYPSDHAPSKIQSSDKIFESKNVCDLPAPYDNLKSNELFKDKHNLSYPINLARNIAREAALTHYVFVSDIELYPSPDVPTKFLQMIARNDNKFKRPKRKVYPLPIFEIAKDLPVPKTKTELQNRYKQKKLIIFHSKICRTCHRVPKFDQWIASKKSNEMNVFTVGKRTAGYAFWEPIYIGAKDDPIYDERFTYETAYDKMPQGYALCALDYEFHVLDNAFLVHRPGIKLMGNINYRNARREQTRDMIHKVIAKEFQKQYGIRKLCKIIGD